MVLLPALANFTSGLSPVSREHYDQIEALSVESPVVKHKASEKDGVSSNSC